MDLVFDHHDSRFNCRSVAVIIEKEKVLLHRVQGNTYWSLPGGRVEMHESSNDTVAREMSEELEVVVTVDRPLWIVENFFNNYNRRLHEVAFYFLVKLPHDNPYAGVETFERMDDLTELHFRWCEIRDLRNVDLFPTFLRTSLLQLPGSVQHIIHKDEAK
jgi:ADP-ribose pyrophosphatase YjhB (NUDIX family)